MGYSRANRSVPLVSVIAVTLSRRQRLLHWLRSASQQTYRHIQILVAAEARTPVGRLIGSLRDPRIQFLCGRSGSTRPVLFNLALQQARGTYVTYLNDDDVHYHDHVERLVEALQRHPDCQVAYSDLYRTHCRALPDGTRQVRAKRLVSCRDFDRYHLCRVPYIPHAAVMHRRELLEKTGPYNQKLRTLDDWDVLRRMAFFTDFLHVNRITGESITAAGGAQRRSDEPSPNSAEYLRQVLAVRSSRPPKPWPKMPDLSIVFLANPQDGRVGEMLNDIRLRMFVPYQLYLPLPEAALARLGTDMADAIGVPVQPGEPGEARLDKALRRCEGDYVAVVPPELSAGPTWAERLVYALDDNLAEGQAIALADTNDTPAVVLRKADLLRARQTSPDASLSRSLQAAGISLQMPASQQPARPFDTMLARAKALEIEGEWLAAAWAYEEIACRHGNSLWMKSAASRALYQAGHHDKRALELCQHVTSTRPTVNSLLLEAKLHRRADRIRQALQRLHQAEEILAQKG